MEQAKPDDEAARRIHQEVREMTERVLHEAVEAFRPKYGDRVTPVAALVTNTMVSQYFTNLRQAALLSEAVGEPHTVEDLEGLMQEVAVRLNSAYMANTRERLASLITKHAPEISEDDVEFNDDE